MLEPPGARGSSAVAVWTLTAGVRTPSKTTAASRGHSSRSITAGTLETAGTQIIQGAAELLEPVGVDIGANWNVGARSRNSRASWRVRLATERTLRSPHKMS